MREQEENRRMGVVIAAPKSGSGKTLLTCALLQALCHQKIKVCSYKCGPDYIDPMFHRSVLNISGGNLDTFFTGEDNTRSIFLENTKTDVFAVVEGVMGLYDGMGGVEEEGSTYHLAKTLQLPIILVVDAHGMGRSILPLLAGFLSYDTAHLICGVILNKVSATYYPTLAQLIQEELSIEVLGYFSQQKALRLESRYLGLKQPEEIQNLKEQVERAAEELNKTVNLDRILGLGRQAVGSSLQSVSVKEDRGQIGIQEKNQHKLRPILAVARDEAFCFYYQENLTMLQRAGFEIVYFSPIHQHKLPEETCAILLGGGYPELFAKELSQNTEMKGAIRNAIAKGVPSIAECGGFMYLHQFISDEKGNTYPMTKILEGSCNYQGKLIRFGYVKIQEQVSNFLPEGEVIKGHEFHYYDSTDNGNGCLARKPVGTKEWKCVWVDKSHWWGFPHLYYPSNPKFVEHFYAAALHFRQVCGNESEKKM